MIKRISPVIRTHGSGMLDLSHYFMFHRIDPNDVFDHLHSVLKIRYYHDRSPLLLYDCSLNKNFSLHIGFSEEAFGLLEIQELYDKSKFESTISDYYNRNPELTKRRRNELKAFNDNKYHQRFINAAKKELLLMMTTP